MILIIVVVGRGLCNAVIVLFCEREVMISVLTGELIWVRGYMSLLLGPAPYG